MNNAILYLEPTARGQGVEWKERVYRIGELKKTKSVCNSEKIKVAVNQLKDGIPVPF
jgi:hypothetical protein